MIRNRRTCEFIRCRHRLQQHLRPQYPTCSSLFLSRSRAREICGEKFAALCCCAAAFLSHKQRLQWVHRNARADRLEEVARDELLNVVSSHAAIPTSFCSGIPHYTRQSAFKDRRFSPLKAEEVQHLTISLSVLHDFEPCARFACCPPASFAFPCKSAVFRLLFSSNQLPLLSICVDFLLRRDVEQLGHRQARHSNRLYRFSGRAP